MSSSHLLETLVQGEVMADGVLPAGSRGAVEGKLPLYPVVDPFHGESFSRRALQRHEYHTGKRERRLLRVFTVILPVPHVQNDVEHLLGVQFGLPRPVSPPFPRPAVAWLLARPAHGPRPGGLANAVRRAREGRAHGGQHARLLQPGQGGQLPVHRDHCLVFASGLR